MTFWRNGAAVGGGGTMQFGSGNSAGPFTAQRWRAGGRGDGLNSIIHFYELIEWDANLSASAAAITAINLLSALTFVEQMSVGHTLTVGENASGNRVGYRRGQWGDFQPDNVPNLQRVFSNLNNNRLVVQASGDQSALPIANIHIERLVPPQSFDFGPPSGVVFDGVNTEFVWIVSGFDFVLGEQYDVSLS